MHLTAALALPDSKSPRQGPCRAGGKRNLTDVSAEATAVREMTEETGGECLFWPCLNAGTLPLPVTCIDLTKEVAGSP